MVGVLVSLAASKCHDLSRDVSAELLLAGAALNDNIHADLAVVKSYELHGNDVGSLMEQLIEGVLAVGSGLTEDDRSCYIIYGLAEAVDGLAVGFHIQLLQVCREAGQSLGIRKYCRAEIAACISLIDADQGIQKGCVLPDIGILSQSVGLCCAVHDRREYFRSECQGQNNCAYAGRGRITAADIVIHEECFQIISALRQRRSLTGNSKHVLGRIYACILEGIPYEGLVGQSLKGCAGLGNNDEEGMCDIDRLQDCCCVVGVNVGDESCFHLLFAVSLCPVLKSDIESAGAEVRAADTDLYYSGELLAGCVCDLACVNLVREISRLLLLACIEVSLVDAVSDYIAALLSAAELMQNEALLTCVDHSAVVKLCVFLCKLSLVSQFLKDCKNIVINCLSGEIVLHIASHGNAVLSNALRTVLTGHYFHQIDMALECHPWVYVSTQKFHIHGYLQPIAGHKITGRTFSAARPYYHSML